MLSYHLAGTPRPIRDDSPALEWHWLPTSGDGPVAPWGGPSRRPKRPISWTPDTGVPTDCFTVQAWLMPAVPLASVEHPLILTDGSRRGIAWEFGLTRHLMPRIGWHDRDGAWREVVGDSLIDVLEPARWLHIALVHHGHGHDPAQPADEYCRWSVYVTPAGEAWPRLVIQEVGPAAFMPEASGRLTLLPGAFAYAEAACHRHAKLPNEFPALGQEEPVDVTFDSDFPGGSCVAPVAVGPRQVVVGCKPGVTDANYWHYSRVTVVDPTDPTPLDVTLLAAPKGQAMLCCLFTSKDGERWERVPGGYFVNDRRLVPQGSLRVRLPVDAPSFYLAAAPPYGSAQVDRLVADLEDDPRARVIEVGRTTGGRPIRGLVLTDPSVPSETKDFLYLQAGQHSPMEQSTGLVLDRLARRLLGDPTYGHFLSRHEVHLVPLVNVDAAELGEAGLTLGQRNSNRYWLGRTVPETEGIRRHLDTLAARPGRMRLALDLHAGGTWPHHTVLYLGRERGYAICPPGWGVELARFLALLEEHTGIAREDAIETGEGVGHFAVAVAVRHGWPAATIEFSFSTWRDVNGTVRAVTQESLELCGERLADALAAFVA